MTAWKTATEMGVDLAELSESWFMALEAEGKSAGTLKAYRYGVTGFLRWHVSQYPDAVPVLDRASVDLFLVDLRRGDPSSKPPRAAQSAGTVKLRYSALRLFSAWLADVGELDRDPLRSMKPPKAATPMVPSLTDAEVAALVKACRPAAAKRTLREQYADKRDEAMVRLLASTGMRAGEVAGLKVSEVDLKQRVVRVERAKGGKQRLVPLLPEVAAAMDRYLRARKAHRHAHLDQLWLGADGSARFGYQGLARALGVRAQAAGIEGFHAHRLRHTAASRWLAAGGSEDGLMAQMGWSDRNMVGRYTADTQQRRALEEAHRLRLDQVS